MNLNNLTWNVYFWSINAGDLRELNIFEHGGFVNNLENILNDNKINSIFSFKEKLKQILKYYFGYRCEWEVLIENFPPNRSYCCTLEKGSCCIEPFYSREKINYVMEETDSINTVLPKDGEYYLLNKFDEKSRKIDICQQVMLNFDIFAEYILRTVGKTYGKEGVL